MIVQNDLFNYDYKIYQDSDYFKFSLDTILLAEFVKLKKNDRVLDMCTGNAPIPMILTKKYGHINIDCVEIQKEVYDLAQKSIEFNNLTNINVYNEDIKKFYIKEKYDVITCNPPYYKNIPTSHISDNEVKRLARHEITITIEEIIDLAYKNLTENGTFYLVHKTERFTEILSKIENAKFGIRRIIFIFTLKNKKSELFLIEASKNKKSDPKIYYLNTDNVKDYKNIFDSLKD